MTDITNAKAMRIEDATFGHLLLCWVDKVRYCAIRVRGGLLCFHAPISGNTEAAARYEARDSMVCIDVGVAVVRWCDKEVFEVGAQEPPGNIVVDRDGISITGKEADPEAFQHGKDRRAWRLENGEPQGITASARLVIRNWEIGVRGENGEFVKFETFPRASPGPPG
jgi:hypothetical protein